MLGMRVADELLVVGQVYYIYKCLRRILVVNLHRYIRWPNDLLRGLTSSLTEVSILQYWSGPMGTKGSLDHTINQKLSKIAKSRNQKNSLVRISRHSIVSLCGPRNAGYTFRFSLKCFRKAWKSACCSRFPHRADDRTLNLE